jgi:hypothetical protein
MFRCTLPSNGGPECCAKLALPAIVVGVIAAAMSAPRSSTVNYIIVTNENLAIC